jgi:hypothetical protein
MKTIKANQIEIEHNPKANTAPNNSMSAFCMTTIYHIKIITQAKYELTQKYCIISL